MTLGAQGLLREEAEYYLKPAREQAMISWLMSYMRGAPPEVLRALAAHPRVGPIIKGYAPVTRGWEKGMGFAAPENAVLSAVEAIMSFVKSIEGKPLLADDQAIKQGTIIGEAAGRIMAGALAAATLKVKLETGINNHRLQTGVYTGANYYQFTIGDIVIEGNMNPQEVESRVKEGVKEGTVEAITEAQGIIRRETDRNQLIDVGE